jgi:hypothetical protein
MEPKGVCVKIILLIVPFMLFLSVHFSCDVSKVPNENGKTFPNSSTRESIGKYYDCKVYNYS